MHCGRKHIRVSPKSGYCMTGHLKFCFQAAPKETPSQSSSIIITYKFFLENSFFLIHRDFSTARTHGRPSETHLPAKTVEQLRQRCFSVENPPVKVPDPIRTDNFDILRADGSFFLERKPHHGHQNGQDNLPYYMDFLFPRSTSDSAYSKIPSPSPQMISI